MRMAVCIEIAFWDFYDRYHYCHRNCGIMEHSIAIC